MQKMMEALSRWCADHRIKYQILECNCGYMVSMPALNIDNIIDMVATLRPLTEDRNDMRHITREGRTIVLVGSSELITDDQLKFATNLVTRKQSAYRSSFGPSTSFGGVTRSKNSKKKKKIAENFEIAGEEQPHTVMDVKGGRLLINDQIVIDNHADLLAQIAEWFARNDPDSLKKAIDDIGDAIKDGANFIK